MWLCLHNKKYLVRWRQQKYMNTFTQQQYLVRLSKQNMWPCQDVRYVPPQRPMHIFTQSLNFAVPTLFSSQISSFSPLNWKRISVLDCCFSSLAVWLDVRSTPPPNNSSAPWLDVILKLNVLKSLSSVLAVFTSQKSVHTYFYTEMTHFCTVLAQTLVLWPQSSM